MIVDEGREAGHVLVSHLEALSSQLSEPGFDVNGVPENDHVDDESEGSELVFLPFAIAVAQFTASLIEDCPAQAVPAFSPIELADWTAPLSLGVEHI